MNIRNHTVIYFLNSISKDADFESKTISIFVYQN